jgi:hypothetical protein
MWELCVAVALAALVEDSQKPQPTMRRISAPTVPDDNLYRRELLKFIPVGTPLQRAAECLEAFDFKAGQDPVFGLCIPPMGPRFDKRWRTDALLCRVQVRLVNDSKVVTDIHVRTVFVPRHSSYLEPDLAGFPNGQ